MFSYLLLCCNVFQEGIFLLKNCFDSASSLFTKQQWSPLPSGQSPKSWPQHSRSLFNLSSFATYNFDFKVICSPICKQTPQNRSLPADWVGLSSVSSPLTHNCDERPRWASRPAHQEFHNQVRAPKPSRAGWHRAPPGGRSLLWTKQRGRNLGFGAQLFWQELGISLWAGTHFTSLMQENRARRSPVALGPSLCLPASRNGVAWDGVTCLFHRRAVPLHLSPTSLKKLNPLAQPHLTTE